MKHLALLLDNSGSVSDAHVRWSNKLSVAITNLTQARQQELLVFVFDHSVQAHRVSPNGGAPIALPRNLAGGTNIARALKLAVDSDPEAIVLVTDGEDGNDQAIADELARAWALKIPVHVAMLETARCGPLLAFDKVSTSAADWAMRFVK